MVSWSDRVKCWYVIIFTFILHLILINFYPINYEFTFSEGAKYFIDFEKKIIKDYFSNQNNTFFFPLIVGLINKIFPIENTLLYTRLFSASSYFMLGLAFIDLFSHYKIKFKCHVFLLFFFLNPLIWTFGYRGTPDLFSASLAFYSFSKILILGNNVNFKIFFHYFLLGISICIKPFSLIYLGLIILLDYKNNIFVAVKKNFLFVTLTLFSPLLYFYIIKINFNFYLIPPVFNNIVIFDYKNVFYILIGYFTFIAISIFPFTFKRYFFGGKINITIFIFSSLALFIYASKAGYIGELDFGFVEKLIPRNLLMVLIFFPFYLCCLYFMNIKKNITNYKLILIIFFYILALSFTRPVQRYLIHILPIIFLFALLNLGKFNIKYLLLVILTIYIPINLLIGLNFHFVSSNTKNIIYFLNNEKIINKTAPGPLYPHSKHFFKNVEQIEYEISFTPGKDVIKHFNFSNFIQRQSYYLNKL
jgi:hypothetical protein